MIYFDTSYLLKCYLNEPGAQWVRSLARQHSSVACCIIGRTEWYAGIHRHQREGRLTPGEAGQLFQVMLADEAAKLWQWLPLTDAVTTAANHAFEVLPLSIFLRSADALHLACALKHGFTEIYSNDKHLLAAAAHFGLVGKNVIP